MNPLNTRSNNMPDYKERLFNEQDEPTKLVSLVGGPGNGRTFETFVNHMPPYITLPTDEHHQYVLRTTTDGTQYYQYDT